jgi:conjugal transfer pilus assembly protein TraL
MNDLDTRIPSSLDEPTRILMWDANQVGIAVACVFLGVMLRDPITWIVIGVFVAFAVGKLTGGKHPRFFVHWAYWRLPFRSGFKRTPPSWLREYIG